MAELRLEPVTRRWVVTGKRPALADGHVAEGACPFCPGNEHLTPKAVCERRDASGAWMVRAFHDRAPIFRIEGGTNRRGEGMYDLMNALGAHEIVVETPQHGRSLAHLSADQVAVVLGVCRDRILDLKQDERFRYVSLFKDQMWAAPSVHGHAHAQILATPVLPVFVESEFRWSQFHYQKKDRCLFCDILRQETDDPKRVVDQTGDFIALCPFASRSPYEVWVLPLRHASSFENDLKDPERMRAFAAFYKSTLERIEKISESLHVAVHTEPNMKARGWPPGWWETLVEDFHWHVEINPDVEGQRRYLGSGGLYYNPIPAEEAALVLRALAPESEPTASSSGADTAASRG
jgi:UDPglucose--hexose-1-phosphate uridylyltransferase